VPDGAVLACTQLSKTFRQGPEQLTVLDDITLSVSAGQSLAIVGNSGSGKTTLLHCLAGLDRPSSGDVLWQGQALGGLSESAVGQLRNQHVGFVYQFHHLMPEFMAWENVALPLMIRGESARKARQEADVLLESVGLKARRTHKPSELSGGERQRVAIARALVTRPACVLADEPTGNLDVAAAEMIQSLLLSLNDTFGVALLLVTHDPQFAGKCHFRGELASGRFSCAAQTVTCSA
jgi:lipoprotein-releasing system ATP-binding protein